MPVFVELSLGKRTHSYSGTNKEANAYGLHASN